MKKILLIVLASIMVLGFAASAFAIHAEIPSETQAVVAKGSTQITLGGEIRVRGWYQHNLAEYDLSGIGFGFNKYSDPVTSASNSWYDTRVRLNLSAVVSPNVKGYIALETVSGSDVYKWGSNNTKPTDLHILEAWILHTGSGLLGIPAGIKIGHMPLALGEKQFFDHTKFGDDAIVLFMDPTKQLHVAALAIKLSDQSASVMNTTTYHGAGGNAEDIDAYVALMTYKINDANTVGANFTWINQSSGDGTSLYPPHFMNVLATGTDTKLYNIGVHGNGKIGNFGYKAEVDYQFGSTTFGFPYSDEKVKFGGYGVMLAANYDLNPVNIRGRFAYGSGDEGEDNLSPTNTIYGSKNTNFQTFLGNDQHYTLIYEYRATGASFNSAPFFGSGVNTGIQNTVYYNVGVDYAPVKDVTVSLDGFIIRNAEVPDKDIFGDKYSKDAGWEIDGKVVYNIAKNLTYQLDAGYFKPGKAYQDTYDVLFGVDAAKTAGVTVVRNSLTLSF